MSLPQFQTIELEVANVSRIVTCSDCFTIKAIQLRIAIDRNRLLTYKQVRNALYRLREKDGEFYHNRFGEYFWY